ncbi:MAG TPA: hypothetical protein DCY56_05905 [Candidatus Omnitrophica bacterium]|nr:hypothetical protein [Candidatus Omnitrophota bacterium]
MDITNNSLTRKRLLITGASGLLGSNLLFFLKDRYDILGLYYKNSIKAAGVQIKQVNILNLNELVKAFDAFSPDVVLHAAALADINRCEDDPALARQVNVVGTENVVCAARRLSATIVYISTDQVYDGSTNSCCETDVPHPLNVYASTKLEAENIVLIYSQGLVLRSNLFGWDVITHRSLAEWVIAELKEGQIVTGFQDVMFSTLYTADIADLLVEFLDNKPKGVYNFGAHSALSKYDFLRLVARGAGFAEDNVLRGFIVETPLRVVRAKNLSLNVTRLESLLRHPVPTIEESVGRFFADRANGIPALLRKCIQRY